jgi:hypothetical protein
MIAMAAAPFSSSNFRLDFVTQRSIPVRRMPDQFPAAPNPAGESRWRGWASGS